MSSCTMPYGLPDAWKRPRRIPSIGSLGNARSTAQLFTSPKTPVQVGAISTSVNQGQPRSSGLPLTTSKLFQLRAPENTLQCWYKSSNPSTRRELFIADCWPSPQASRALASASKEQAAPGSDVLGVTSIKLHLTNTSYHLETLCAGSKVYNARVLDSGRLLAGRV